MSEKKGTRRAGGEGLLRQRKDGLYETTVQVIDRFGHRKTKSIYGHTEREALAKRRVFEAGLARGQPADPSKQPLEDYLHDWLQGFAYREISVRKNFTQQIFVFRKLFCQYHLSCINLDTINK